MEKNKQLPFSSSVRQSSHSLELVHSNVWTSSIQSTSGCHYYVLFVDDYSRYTWLFPLKLKYDVLPCFYQVYVFSWESFLSHNSELSNWWRGWIHFHPISDFSRKRWHPSSTFLPLQNPTKWTCGQETSPYNIIWSYPSSHITFTTQLLGWCIHHYCVPHKLTSHLNPQFLIFLYQAI